MGYFIFFLLLIILLPVGLVILIAWLLSYSRKQKRQKIVNALPPDTDFYAAVRINSSKANDAVIKMKGFECSGIVYVRQGKAYFTGTTMYNNLEFDLTATQILWVGVQIQNGALQWFSMKNNQDTYFFNVDTGTFIFRFSSKGDTTRGVYNKLVDAQSLACIRNIGKE